MISLKLIQGSRGGTYYLNKSGRKLYTLPKPVNKKNISVYWETKGKKDRTYYYIREKTTHCTRRISELIASQLNLKSNRVKSNPDSKCTRRRKPKKKPKQVKFLLNDVTIHIKNLPEKIKVLNTTFDSKSPFKEWLVGKQTVDKASYERLRPGVWLNDVIINAYLHLLQVRSDSLGKKQWFVTSFLGEFFKNNKQTFVKKMSRWLRKFLKNKPYTTIDRILLPVNINQNHWVLIEVDITGKRISYYDSLKGRLSKARLSYLQAGLYEYLNTDLVIKMKTFFDTWKINSRAECPTQPNGYDCGVYTLFFARLIGSDISLKDNSFYGISDLSHTLRGWIMYELRTGKLHLR